MFPLLQTDTRAFVHNVIKTSQHGILLSVIEIISCSHMNFKQYFSLFVLSEFLFLI